MTLKKSLDDGASWQVETLIYAGPAAYSLVVPLTNDSLGVVYERNGPGENALPCVYRPNVSAVVCRSRI